MGLLELDRTNGQEYWNMDLKQYSGEVDPKGFSDNMASNCNGNENQHSLQATNGDDDAPPSYADAFPPLPTTPSDSGSMAAPFLKWGKRGEKKSAPKPTPKAALTNITQVCLVVLSFFIMSFHCSPL